jgi:hypothetical protein
LKRTALSIAVSFAGLSSVACASMQASRARQERLQAELDVVRYSQQPQEVWQQVRQLLADRGCPLAGEDAKAVGQDSSGFKQFLSAARETRPYREEEDLLQILGFTAASKPEFGEGSISLDTGWRRREGDRYHVDGLVMPDGFRVVFMRVEQDISNYKEIRSRDLEMELELARRVDPRVAARIEKSMGGPPSR